MGLLDCDRMHGGTHIRLPGVDCQPEVQVSRNSKSADDDHMVVTLLEYDYARAQANRIDLNMAQ